MSTAVIGTVLEECYKLTYANLIILIKLFG